VQSGAEGYTFSADIYSFGITIMELVLSIVPASRERGLEEIRELSLECPKLASDLEKLRRIAEHCTLSRPDDRPDAAQVLHWLSDEWYVTEVPLCPVSS
jgi:serine/threonine protein kinase